MGQELNRCLCSFCSVKGHGADLCVVPAGHLGIPLESNELACAGLVHHAFLLALVQKLPLAGSQSNALSSTVLLLVLMESNVDVLRAHSLVGLAIEETRPKGRPCWHQKLLLVGLHIDHAVFILHKVLQARGCVQYGWD